MITKIQNTPNTYRNTKSKTNSFKGAIPAKLVKDNFCTRFSVNFAEHGGEKISNIINSVGKIAVAPLIIAFNPFSKESNETKKYSACKQPMEGLLNLGIALTLLSQTDKYVENLSKKGKLADNLNVKGLSGEALEIAEKRLGIFKDRVGLLASIVAIPVTTAVINWAYPKVMAKFFPQKNETERGGK